LPGEYRTARNKLFGEAFQKARLRLSEFKSLREFASANGFHAADISRIETGERPPPTANNKIGKYLRALEVSNLSERQEFRDLAAISRGEIPDDICENGIRAQLLLEAFKTIRIKVPVKE